MDAHQPETTLVERIRALATAAPERPVFTFLRDGEDESAVWTRGDVDRRARTVAAALQQAGAAGERVLLLYPPGLELIGAFLGCLYAGAVAVPAYPPASRGLSRLAAIVADARPRLALTESAHRRRFAARCQRSDVLRRLSFLATDELEPELAAAWRSGAVDAETLAFLQYTSGSTATPKGVRIRHAQLAHNEALIARAFAQNADSVIVSWLPLYHDMGLIGGALQPLWSGSRAVLFAPTAFLQRPARWLEAISRYRATTSGAPDFAYELCARQVDVAELAEKGVDLSSWRVAFNGSEPVRAPTLERFAAAFAPLGFVRRALLPCYGLAEATLFVAGTAVERSPTVLRLDAAALTRGRSAPIDAAADARPRILVGSGAWAQEARLVDPHTGEPCVAGRIGELWLSGPSVADGYWRRGDDAFGARLAGDPRPYLRTGDLAFEHRGELFIAGRLKDLIILRGRNHYPQDLEHSAAEADPALAGQRGAAFAVEVAGREEVVIVHEVARRADAADAGPRLAAAIRAVLAAEHELRPHEVVLVRPRSLPLTSSGKIQRHRCRELYEQEGFASSLLWRSGALDSGVSTVDEQREAPRSFDEAAVELLGELAARAVRGERETLDADLPLVRQGLDSVAAVELKHDIEERFGVEVELSELLEELSLTGLTRDVAARFAALDGRPKTASGDPDRRRFPLSDGQRGLCFLDRLAPQSAAYVMAVAVRFPPGLDVEALHRALQNLVDRHGALRSTLHDAAADDDETATAHQRVHRGLTLPLPRIDAAGWDGARLAAELDHRAYRPFDLARGPLIRNELFTLGEDHILLLALHHAVADFWSLTVMARDLGVAYERQRNASPTPPALPPVAYGALVEEQLEALAGPRGEALWRYWRAALDGAELVLELPTDRPRPAVQTHDGAAHGRALGHGLSRRIRALGQSHGTTLFVTLLAAFHVLIHRLSGQTSFLVGSPTAGRSSARSADVVGYFVNPVALRAELAGGQSFAALLAQARATVLAALAHQDYPLLRLTERLQPERDPSRSALFQVMFVLQKVPRAERAELAAIALGAGGVELELGGGLVIESVHLAERATPFELILRTAQVGGEVLVSAHYNRDLFDRTTIARFLDAYAALLAAATEEPSSSLAGLPLLPPGARHQLRELAAGPPQADTASIVELVSRQALAVPERVALVHAEATLSHAALLARSRGLAAGLVRLGIGAEDRVAVELPRGLELVVAILGVWLAGAAWVPIDPAYPRRRRELMLADSGAVRLLTEGAPELLAAPAPSAVRLPAGPHPEQLAHLIYTSGSTGRPKAVMITHGSVAALLAWARTAFSSGELERVLASTSVCFDLSVFELAVPLAHGTCIELVANVLELAPSSRATLINSVPSAVGERLLQAPLPVSVRAVNLAGEPLRRALVEALLASPTVERVRNLYGPSEDTTYSTWASFEDPLSGEPTLGRPLPATRARILDRRLEALPIGVPGELCLGGAGLARGYLDRPGRTARSFVPDPQAERPGERLYRTGDRASWRPDGELIFLGRADQQIKLRGFRVELGEIEARLLACSEVREAVVIVAGSGATARLVAYVGGEPGALDPAALGAVLRRSLPDFMVPGPIVPMAALPRLPNGKLDRRSLPSPTVEAATSVAARTPLEELLVGMFAELLPGASPDVESSFFDLGGHSLLAGRLLVRIREATGVELPLLAVFEDPTPQRLAQRLARRLTALGAGRAPARRRRLPRPDRLPLSFAQERFWAFEELRDPSADAAAAYLVSGGWRFRGALDPAVLARAWTELVERHESLRTRIVTTTDGPEQVIEPWTGTEREEAVIPLVDLSQAGEHAAPLTLELARRPFALARAPLWRLVLLRLAPDEHRLVLTAHHLIVDAWSLTILQRELSLAYEALRARRRPALPALTWQVADEAVWQRSLPADPWRSDLDFWRQELAGLPALAWPEDRPQRRFSHRGGRVDAALPAPLGGDGLRAVCRRLDVTPFMFLLAVFQTFLHRLCDQDDLAVATPIAGRDHGASEAVVGCFVNTLVLRGRPRPEEPFAAFVAASRAVVLAAHERRQLPFERLLAELRPEPEERQRQLVEAVLTFTAAPSPRRALQGLDAEPFEIFNRSARFTLVWSVAEGEGGGASALEHDAERFDRTTTLRWQQHLQALLAAALARPESRLGELPLLPAAAERQVLREWGSGAAWVDRGQTVVSLFLDRARRTGEAVAVSGPGAAWTVGELARRSELLAAALVARGSRAEAVIGLCSPRGIDFAVGMIAILRTGGAYLPLVPEDPAPRLALLLAEAGAVAVLTERRWRSRLPAELPTVVLDESSARRPSPLPEVDPGQLAAVLFTSGSTGRPKGVGILHRGIVRLVDGAGHLAFGPGESIPHLAATTFDATTLEVWGALLNGGRLVLPPASSLAPGEIARLVRRERLSALFLTAGWLDQLAAIEAPVRAELASLRQLLTGGDVVSPAAVHDLLRSLPGLWISNNYGPTEGTTIATFEPFAAPPPTAAALTIGRPIAGTEVVLLNRRARPVVPGALGELALAGDGLARGYLRRPARTAASFVPSPVGGPGERLYLTGDLARFRGDGRLELWGRRDQQIKVRGFRIEPGEVEAALVEHPEIAAAAVLARLDSAGEKVLVAHLVPQAVAPTKTPSTEALRRFLAARLPAHLVPDRFLVLDRLPLNAHGKLDRHALPELAAEPPRLDAAFVAPRSAFEEQLARIYGAVLGVERVGVKDDFFALGGHSLHAARILARLRDELGVEVPSRAIFEAPTLDGLGRAIVRAFDRDGAASRLVDTAPPRQLEALFHRLSVHRLAGAGSPIPRRDDPLAPAPLSYAQERLWLLDRLQPGHPAYIIHGAARLHGSLAPARLAACLQALAKRHQALATVFELPGREPQQRWLPTTELGLPTIDLRTLRQADREALVAGLGRAATRRPFSLDRAPLCRALLYRLGEEAWVVSLALHHIIADGASLRILLRELGALYRGEPLAPLPLRALDHAAWQRRPGAEEPQRWRARLGELRAQLSAASPRELPSDRPRPALRSARGAQVPCRLPRALGERLDALARTTGTTPFVVLLTVFKGLLAHLSGARSGVVGAPASTRDHHQLEGVVGCFINTLVLCDELDGAQPFATALRRVGETVTAAWAHRDLPFEKLVEALNPARDLSRNPLVQVLFGLQEEAPETPDLGPAITVAMLDLDPGTALLDLYVSLSRQAGPDGELGGWWEYDRELFDRSTIRRWQDAYLRLLWAVVEDPDRPLVGRSLLGAVARQQLLVEWNDRAARTTDELFSETFARRAARRSEAIALICEERALSYGELARRVERLAARLVRSGAASEVVVALELAPGLAQVTAWLAVLLSGAAYLPLEPGWPAARRRLMREDAGSSLAITGDDDTGPRIERLRELERVGARELSARRLAYVIYTSGSTGAPKGVMVDHAQLAYFLAAMDELLTARDGTWLAVTGCGFDIAVLEVLWTLSRGQRLVLEPRRVGWEETVPRTLELQRVSHLQSTPSLASLLLALPSRPRFAGLELWCLGGEALSPALLERLRQRTAARFLNLYGPTEATVWATVAPLDGPRVTLGRGLRNTFVEIVDRRLRTVMCGVHGELAIGGGGVARGYRGRAAMTAERFVPSPWGEEPGARLYLSGDLARFLADGRLEFLGRRDEQLKIRGHRVEPREIESWLCREPAVAEAAVALLPSGAGPRLTAFVVLDGAEPFATWRETLREALRRRLPEAMVPAHWQRLEALPRTANGKLDRRALTSFESSPEATAGRTLLPQGAAEERVAAIWRQVLAVERVGVETSFFDSGGTSLSLVELQRRLGEAVGKEIPLAELFHHPTVRAQARRFVAAAPSRRDVDGAERPAIRRTVARGLRQREALRSGGIFTPRQRQRQRQRQRPRQPSDGALDRRRQPSGGTTPHSGGTSDHEQAARRTLVLPNGLEIDYLEKAELEHFYNDIFEEQVYLRHAPSLPEAPCVLDVGANIGLFTLFMQRFRPRARIYAFEPAPPLFALLRRNASRHAPRARLFNVGLADRAGTARFTFYPRSTGMSSFHARHEEERQLLALLLDNEARQGSTAARELLPHRDDFLARRLEEQHYDCRLDTLSRVMAREGVTRIDLLKLDVQKSELAVLAGLAEDDWPKIVNLAIEVHDIDGRVDTVRQLLAAQGYEIHVEQDPLYAGSSLYLVYATARNHREPRTAKAAPPLATAGRERKT